MIESSRFRFNVADNNCRAWSHEACDQRTLTVKFGSVKGLEEAAGALEYELLRSIWGLCKQAAEW